MKKYLLILAPIYAVLFWLNPWLALFLSIFILFIVLSIALPKYFLYALVFFYPWIAWTWSYAVARESVLFGFVGGRIDLPICDIVAIIVGFAFGINLLLRYFWDNDKKWKLELPGFFFFLGFMLIGYLSLANSELWYSDSLKYLLRPIAFFYLFFVIPLYNLIKTKKDYYIVLWIMFIIGVIGTLMGAYSFIGIFEHIHRAHPIAIFGYPFWGLNQNLLAEILVLTIPSSIMLFFIEKNKNLKPYIWLGIMGMLLVSVLTFSRTAWLAILLGMIISTILLWKENKKFFIKWGALALLIIIPFVSVVIAYSSSYTAQSSNWGRMEMTEFAYFIWQDHPWVGNGVGTFYYRLGQTPMYTMNLGQPFDAHGVLQKVGSEMGLLGLLFYFSLVIWLGKNLFFDYMTVKKNQDKIIIVMAGLIVILALFYQGFNTNYFSPKMWVPLTIAIALHKFYNKKEKKLEIY